MDSGPRFDMILEAFWCHFSFFFSDIPPPKEKVFLVKKLHLSKKKIFMGSENLKKFSLLKINPNFAGSCFRVIILTEHILKKIFVSKGRVLKDSS